MKLMWLIRASVSFRTSNCRPSFGNSLWVWGVSPSKSSDFTLENNQFSQFLDRNIAVSITQQKLIGTNTSGWESKQRRQRGLSWDRAPPPRLQPSLQWSTWEDTCSSPTGRWTWPQHPLELFPPGYRSTAHLYQNDIPNKNASIYSAVSKYNGKITGCNQFLVRYLIHSPADP